MVESRRRGEGREERAGAARRVDVCVVMRNGSNTSAVCVKSRAKGSTFEL